MIYNKKYLWEDDDITIVPPSNSLDEVVENRGYNPNRDESTGRFTFGSGKSKSFSGRVKASLREEALKHDTAQDFMNSIPLVYHGSSTPLEVFNNDQGTFFTDDYMNADGYGSGENVYEGHLYLMNPKVIDAKGKMWNELNTEYGKNMDTGSVVGSVDQDKHDGVIFNNIRDNWIDDAEAQDPGTIYYAYKPADSFLNEEQLTEIYDEAHKNSLHYKDVNARGYNPNRDESTGRFTFGSQKQRSTIAARERDIRFNDYETLVAVDGTGKILIDKKGDKSQVKISKEEMKMMREAKDLIFTHNHPSSASFSRSDLVTASKVDAKEVRIISEKYEYSLKPGDEPMSLIKTGENNWAAPENLVQVWDYHDNQLFGKYKPMVDSGELSVNEAWNGHTHEIMTNLAEVFGATYTRKELK